MRSYFLAASGLLGLVGAIPASLPTLAGYSTGQYLGNAAIVAPYDKYGFNSLINTTIFTTGAFVPQRCADACTQLSQHARAFPPTDGSPIETCQFFNTYIVYQSSPNIPGGQYCAVYTESWPSIYATNQGFKGGPNNHYSVLASMSYSNATNPGSAQPLPAVYQAKKEIQASGDSAAPPYCSSVLGYTIRTTTSTALVTAYTGTVVTKTSTIPTTAVSGTVSTLTSVLSTSVISGTVSTVTQTVSTITTTLSGGGASKRAAAATVVKPSVLSKYPANIVSSACVLAVTSPAIRTIFTSTTVATATSTSLTTVSSIKTVATSVSLSLITTYTSTTTTLISSSLTTLSQTLIVTTTSAPAPLSTFALYITPIPSGTTQPSYIGLLDTGTNFGHGNGYQETTYATQPEAALFSLDSSGHVTIVTGPGSAPGDLIYFWTGGSWSRTMALKTAADASAQNEIPLVCAIDPTSAKLTCQGYENGPAMFGDCAGVLGVVEAATTFPSNCSPIRLYAQAPTVGSVAPAAPSTSSTSSVISSSSSTPSTISSSSSTSSATPSSQPSTTSTASSSTTTSTTSAADQLASPTSGVLFLEGFDGGNYAAVSYYDARPAGDSNARIMLSYVDSHSAEIFSYTGPDQALTAIANPQYLNAQHGESSVGLTLYYDPTNAMYGPLGASGQMSILGAVPPNDASVGTAIPIDCRLYVEHGLRCLWGNTGVFAKWVTCSGYPALVKEGVDFTSFCSQDDYTQGPYEVTIVPQNTTPQNDY